jgi:hypothetical protein
VALACGFGSCHFSSNDIEEFLFPFIGAMGYVDRACYEISQCTPVL